MQYIHIIYLLKFNLPKPICTNPVIIIINNAIIFVYVKISCTRVDQRTETEFINPRITIAIINKY